MALANGSGTGGFLSPRVRRKSISSKSAGSDKSEAMNLLRVWEEDREEEEDHDSSICFNVGGGSGSITTNLDRQAECLDPNCSYNHSSAESFRHQRGTLNGFFLFK